MSTTATNFTKITHDAVKSLVVVPPYEPKSTLSQWVRGAIRERGPGYSRDFIITGPKLTITYSGCKWNKLVFNADSSSSTQSFIAFLEAVDDHFWQSICTNCDKYKPGAKTSARFTHDGEVVKPSSDPSLYPDEIRTRLSSKRQQADINGDIQYLDVVDAVLTNVSTLENVEPSAIKAGGSIIPVIKFSYYRNIEKFGLVLTVLKGVYYPPAESPSATLSNADWQMDITCD